MDTQKKNCMGCMRQIDASAIICPHCSHNTLEKNREFCLQEKTRLAGRYYIGSTISIEVDSVTYIAYDLVEKKVVELIEFYPENIVTRDGFSTTVAPRPGQEVLYNTSLQEFVRLWKTIEELHVYNSLPTVLDVFLHNSTAYVVLRKINSLPLKKYISDQTKLLSWNNCLSAFKEVITAVSKLHSIGINHCAISASTILVGSDGRLHLSGFSISKTKCDNSLLHRIPESGYSPIELYDRRIAPGAYTDVYSIAAVMYFCLTGLEPQSAIERISEDSMMIPFEIASSLDSTVIDALYKALQIYPQNRTKTIQQFCKEITGIAQPEIQTETAPVEQNETEEDEDESENEAEEKEKSPSKASSVIKIGLALVFAFVIIFCSLYATVLYKNINISFLNDAFSAFSFLPINSEPQTTEPTEPSETQETKPESAVVPDFLSLTYSDILNNKTFNKKFRIKYEFEESDTIPKNSIISQSIEADEKVKYGTEITIVVSTGKAISSLQDVIGMSYEKAYDILTSDGFVVEKDLVENDGTHTAGEVFKMSRVAGLEFEKNTVIVLSVWDEVPTTESTTESTSEATTEPTSGETNIYSDTETIANEIID